jgi:hypothetical protein
MSNTEEMLSKCSGKRKVMQCSASCRQCVLMTTTPYVHIAFLQKDQSIRVKTIGVKKKGEISLFLSLSLSLCVCAFRFFTILWTAESTAELIDG